MLALVMPGWLLRVGLMPLTCLYVLARFVPSQITSIAVIWDEFTNLARITSLLPQLTHSSLLGRLAFVDQTSGELNAEGLDGRAVLHDDHRAHGFAGVFENRHDGNGIHAGRLAGLASGGFPDALLAVL
jgi:hypothetical protein